MDHVGQRGKFGFYSKHYEKQLRDFKEGNNMIQLVLKKATLIA